MSIDTQYKDFILSKKTIEEIESDFIALFPQFASYDMETLDIYIDLTFYVIPAWFINVGFDTAYYIYKYALAHILISQGIQSDNSSSSDVDRLSNLMSAGGLSISYQQLSKATNLSEWEIFFGTTNYGKMVLMVLKANGLNASKGVGVV